MDGQHMLTVLFDGRHITTMYENVNFYATDHPMNLAEDTYARLDEAEHYARDERENPEAYLPFADGENGPSPYDIPYEEPPLFQFGQIIRPGSRFIDNIGTVWSCHEKNAHSVTFFRCYENGEVCETVPSIATRYKGITDAQVMNENGLTPLMIPDNMLICHCQFRATEYPVACTDCDDLGLIHMKGVEMTPERVDIALIDTIANDLYYAGEQRDAEACSDQAVLEWTNLNSNPEERRWMWELEKGWEAQTYASCI